MWRWAVPPAVSWGLICQERVLMFSFQVKLCTKLVLETVPTRVFPTMMPSALRLSLWMCLLVPLTPWATSQAWREPGLQKSPLAGRPGGSTGCWSGRELWGRGLIFSRLVSPLLGGTWLRTAGTARRRAQNMGQENKAAKNTASLPLECSLGRKDLMIYQSCAF